MKLNSKIVARILLVAFLILMILLFTGCKSTKKLVEKKQEKISVLEHKDIKTAEEIQLDVTIFKTSSSQKITITPKDPEKAARIIRGKDTTDIFNADVVIENNTSEEKKEDKGTTNRSTSDKSSKNSQSNSREKNIDLEKTGTHPAFIWGGLLLFLIILILLYLKNKIPFL